MRRLWLCLLLAVVAVVGAPGVADAAAGPGPGTLITIAGDGSDRASGDGGRARSAGLRNPVDVESDAEGNLFIIDNWTSVRRVDARTGLITTVAGGGTGEGDGGPATGARFSYLNDVALSPTTGDLYVADGGTDRVRRVDAVTGRISTVIGTGRSDSPAVEGAPGTSTDLRYPHHVTVDAAGTVYVADGRFGDGEPQRILKLDVGGKMHVLLTRDDPPGPTRADPPLDSLDAMLAADDGSVYFTDSSQLVRRIAPDGTVGTVAGTEAWFGFFVDGAPARMIGLGDVRALAFDVDGALLIAESSNRHILKLTADGALRTVAGVRGAGFSPDGTPARDAYLDYLDAMTVTPDGTLVFTQSNEYRVRGISPGNVLPPRTPSLVDVSALELTDGRPYEQTRIRNPKALTTGTDGFVYLADTNSSRIRRIDPVTGRTILVAGSGAFAFNGDGPALTTALNRPRGVAAEPGGTVLIADTDNSRIRRLDPATGAVTTVAGNGRWGYGGDGGPAGAASLAGPQGVAVAPDGTIFVADTRNGRVRRIDSATGRITTVARSTHPRALAVDGATLYIADDTEGTVYSLTGGVLSRFTTGLRNPGEMAVDGADLLVTEPGANRVLRIGAEGGIAVVAGTGGPGEICGWICSWLGPDGVGDPLRIALNQPQGLARTADGGLWITDSGHDRVVRVSPT